MLKCFAGISNAYFTRKLILKNKYTPMNGDKEPQLVTMVFK